MEAAPNLSRPVFQELGHVRAIVGPRLTVETAAGTFDALRAASCLLAPSPGDEVLVAVPPRGELWVLAVLRRADEALPCSLRVEGDLELDASGTVALRGTGGVELRTPHEVSIAAGRMRVNAVHTALHSEELSYVGRLVTAHAQTVKSVLGTIDTVVDRLSQHIKRSYRFIEEMDVTRAEEIDARAASTMTFRAKNAFMAAKDLVKIDGEQIHMG